MPSLYCNYFFFNPMSDATTVRLLCTARFICSVSNVSANINNGHIVLDTRVVHTNYDHLRTSFICLKTDYVHF